MRSFTLHIFTIRGIPILLHWSFLAVFLLFSWTLAEALDAPLAFGILLYGLLFAIVAAHELAHALTAARYGYRTRDIMLLPVGGVASLQRIPEDPRQEAAIAFAGPALNLVLAAASFAYIYFSETMFYVNPWEFWSVSDILGNDTRFTQTVVWFFKINEALALFNLLPVFPSDGGRLLRAALVGSGRTYPDATATALAVSRVFLLGFVLLGFFSPLLWVVAFVLWSAGAAEARSVRTRHGLRHLRAGHLLPQQMVAVEPGTPLGDLVPTLAAGGQRSFPVLARGALVGIVGERELAGALSRDGGADLPASAVMRPVLTVNALDALAEVNRRLEEHQAPVAVIMDDGEVAGLVTADLLAALADRLGPDVDA